MTLSSHSMGCSLWYVGVPLWGPMKKKVKEENLLSCKILDLEILDIVVCDASWEDGLLHLILFNQNYFDLKL